MVKGCQIHRGNYLQLKVREGEKEMETIKTRVPIRKCGDSLVITLYRFIKKELEKRNITIKEGDLITLEIVINEQENKIEKLILKTH